MIEYCSIVYFIFLLKRLLETLLYGISIQVFENRISFDLLVVFKKNIKSFEECSVYIKV